MLAMQERLLETAVTFRAGGILPVDVDSKLDMPTDAKIPVLDEVAGMPLNGQRGLRLECLENRW